MPRSKDCPKCGQDITDSYEQDDYDSGIVGGWYCDQCNEGFTKDYEPPETDVEIGPAGQGVEKCPKCLSPLEMGYGLAGGGIGPYMYCPNHGVVHKSQDPT